MNSIFIKKIFSNKIIQYIFSRYFVYFIQFLNSIIIAVQLGPLYLGIWGFINLIIQYFEQLNFGLSQSFNALGAINKNDKTYVSKLFGSTLTCLSVISLLSLLLFFLNDYLSIGIGDNYNFREYGPIIAIIVILNYFIPAFLSLLRIYGGINIISIAQAIQPISIFIFINFYQGEMLLNTLVWVLLIAFCLVIILYLKYSPIKVRISLDGKIIRLILKKGQYLFLYSASFYFILLTTKAFISGYYSVEKFGYFTFAFSLGNAILLLFKSFVFLIFPKVVNRLAHLESDEAMKMVDNVRKDYVTLVHMTGHLAILCFPIFILFFPKYTDTIIAFNLVVLSLVVYTHCFGYQELMIAKGKDRRLGVIALISLIISIFVSLYLIRVLEVGFEFVILSTMISYIIFLSLLIYGSQKELSNKFSNKDFAARIFPLRLLIPFMVSLIFSSLRVHSLLFIIPLLMFIILNRMYIIDLKKTFTKILNNPNVADI